MSWQTVPLRQLITPNNRRNRPDLPLLSVVRDKGIIKRKLDKSDNHNIIPEDLSNYKVVSEGQFVINKMKAWQGSCGVSPYYGIVSPAYFVFDLDIENSRFFNYAIRSRAYVDEFGRISKGIRVDQWDLDLGLLKYIRFHLPPRDEQDQIVRYLDWKVSQINKLINAKRRQIELLGEQKRVVINDAVTKGGEGWQKRRLKSIALISYGLGEPPALTPEGIPIIRATNIERGKIVSNDLIHTLPENIPVGKDVVLSEGNIIVVRSGAYSGDVGYITNEWSGAFAGYDMLLRVKLGEPRFLLYALLSEYVLKDQWYLRRIRSAQPHLNAEDIGSSYIFFPPAEEQRSIAQHLNMQCGYIDKVISKLIDEITLFAEYRTRLISDVVTGKLDVRSVIVPEYEAVEDFMEADGNSEDTEEMGEV